MLMYPSYVYVPFSRGAREVYTYIYDNAYVYINIYILITFSSVPWIHNHFSHHHHSRVCLRDVSHRRDRSLQAAECFSGSPPAQGRPRWLVWISGDRRVRPERRNHGEEGEESKMSIDERENKCFDWRKRERDLTDWQTDWLEIIRRRKYPWCVCLLGLPLHLQQHPRSSILQGREDRKKEKVSASAFLVRSQSWGYSFTDGGKTKYIEGKNSTKHSRPFQTYYELLENIRQRITYDCMSSNFRREEGEKYARISRNMSW